MNPAFIGAKSPLLMNGLDSIVINFPQVQPRQSVTSIKARQLCHFRARNAGLSGAAPGLHFRPWPAGGAFEQRFALSLVWISRHPFLLPLYFVLTSYFFCDVMEIKLHRVF